MSFKGLFGLFSVLVTLLFLSCTKLNESTDLGDDLIPAVDNVNTFDTTLYVDAAYFPFNDSVRHILGENMALGRLNDPVFGGTNADMYFNLSSTVYNSNPFINDDSANFFIDSVVLSLAYQFGYGDTTNVSQLSVQVSEIASGNGFVDTSLYRYDNPGFTTTGAPLGSRTFSVRDLKDSIRIGGAKYTSTLR